MDVIQSIGEHVECAVLLWYRCAESGTDWCTLLFLSLGSSDVQVKQLELASVQSLEMRLQTFSDKLVQWYHAKHRCFSHAWLYIVICLQGFFRLDNLQAHSLQTHLEQSRHDIWQISHYHSFIFRHIMMDFFDLMSTNWEYLRGASLPIRIAMDPPHSCLYECEHFTWLVIETASDWFPLSTVKQMSVS